MKLRRYITNYKHGNQNNVGAIDGYSIWSASSWQSRQVRKTASSMLTAFEMYHVWQYVVFNLLKSFFFEYFYRTIFLWRKKVKKDLEKNKESAVIDTRYIRFSSFHSLFHMSSIIMFVLPITSDTDVPPCHVAKLYIIISFGLPLPILPLF